METELTDIKKYTRIYNNPPNAEAFIKAVKILAKYHKQYGTIDVSIIKNQYNNYEK